MTVRRLIALEGGCNFRDFGGYETVDGHSVRSGLLFRSGVLAYFTARDDAILEELGIQTICDLRRHTERTREPTRWPGINQVRQLFQDDDQGQANTRELTSVRSSSEAHDAMLHLYDTMPQWLQPRLRSLFDALRLNRIPLVVHCSAGKDRTGLAAALLLELLGVPRETILADYVLTNEAVDLEWFIQNKRQAQLGLSNVNHPMIEIPATARGSMLAADPDYLSAALTRIECDYGSVTRYLAGALGVTEARCDQIKSLLID